MRFSSHRAPGFGQSNLHHHKQYSLIATSKISHCLPQLQITKSTKFSPATTNSTQPYTPLPRNILFQKLAGNLGKPFLSRKSLGPLKKIFATTLWHIKYSFTGSKSETKRWSLRLTLRPPSLNWNRDTKDQIWAALIKTLCPKPPPTHPPTIRELQTTKIRKWSLLSLPHCFLKEGSLYQHWKANHTPLSGIDLRSLD